MKFEMYFQTIQRLNTLTTKWFVSKSMENTFTKCHCA